jgi:hypothetical protein
VSAGGLWIAFDRPWHETSVVNCPICGRLILRQAWEFDGGAGRIQVCGESCEELYESYWKPAHGTMVGQ